MAKKKRTTFSSASKRFHRKKGGHDTLTRGGHAPVAIVPRRAIIKPITSRNENP
jgi:hypothetical protein